MFNPFVPNPALKRVKTGWLLRIFKNSYFIARTFRLHTQVSNALEKHLKYRSFQPGLLRQYLTAVAFISSSAKKKNIGSPSNFKKSYLLHSSFIYGSSHLQSFVEAAKNCLSPVAFCNTLKGLTYCLLFFL